MDIEPRTRAPPTGGVEWTGEGDGAVPTLTRNLFTGSGPGDHRLDVVEGHWPDDLDGAVLIVGPDKREPGGHWFGEHGVLCRIDCRPGPDGRLGVRARRVDTRVARLRDRMPWLFTRVAFAELSPFGVTNLANTNVVVLDGRCFLGYDAGRPVEVDLETLAHLTPVGGNDEWHLGAPGVLEPLASVTAHPGLARDERALYFVNSSIVPGGPVSVARWGLSGPVERWPVTGIGGPIDSIHDVAVTRDHVVFCDLPFVVEPETFRGGRRTRPAQDVTHLWIVAKADLRSTPPGSPVPVVEVELPLPTGHLSVGEDDAGGVLTVNLEHIPFGDLMLPLDREARSHTTGEPYDVAYEGLVALAPQPGAVGRYRIDATTGAVLDAEVVWDDRFWGAVLTTRDQSTPAARASVDDLWYSGCGYDPELVSEDWWRLYGDGACHHLVHPDELPPEGRPASIAHFDMAAGKVDDVWAFAPGAAATPPTFVPRRDQSGPGDGYVVVLVHTVERKELHVFDSGDLGRGPLAVAAGGGWEPPLLLHSCWAPSRTGPRPSSYRVPLRRDVAGALRGLPGTVAGMARMARMAASEGRAGGQSNLARPVS